MGEPEVPQTPIIGGPVCTRTADRSLHVSLLPGGGRLCRFDCIYCPFPRAQRFPHWPRPGDVGSAVASALHAAPGIESITISGPGEPTLHPQFGHALADVLSARGVRPGLPVRIVTHAQATHHPQLRRLLDFADERIVRIDVGGERISRPRDKMERGTMISSLRSLRNLSVESVFIEGPDSNVNEHDVDEWIALLGEIQPRRVYVTTIAEPALVASVHPASIATLGRIAQQLREHSGIEAVVLP
jgi:wyosine [tRNA(Phe)-imidazoG37] synthetase (radical SAM superfamily)